MKNFCKLFFMAIIATISLSGCDEEKVSGELNPAGWGSVETKEYSIIADNLSSSTLSVQSGDEFSVFSTDAPDDNQKFVFENGNLVGEAATTGDLYAFFPYSESHYFSFKDSIPSIKVEVPAERTFSSDIEQNGFGKIGVDGVDVKPLFTKVSLDIMAEYDYHIDSIKIVGNNNEKLAGEVIVSLRDMDLNFNFNDNSSESIVLKGDINLAANEEKNITFSIIPTDFTDGLTIYLYNGVNAVEKSYSALNITLNGENKLDDFVLKMPEFFIEYKAPAALNIEGFISEYKDGLGKVYFASKDVPANILKNQTTITEIIVPDEIESIGDYAFAGTSNLVKVNIGTAILSKEDSNNSDLVTSVTSTSSLKSLGKNVFQGSNVVEIVLPASVTNIKGSFAGLETAYTIYCLATVPPTIDQDSFSESLEKVFVPKEQVDNYRNTWTSCYEKILAIGDTGTEKPTIGTDYYIEYERESALVAVAEGYTHIYDSNSKKGRIFFETSAIPADLFYNKSEEVTSILISAKVTSIGDQAFRGLKTELLSVTVEEGSELKSIGYMAFQACNVATFDFTKATKLTSVGNTAFGECYLIMSYDFLPSSVKTIELGAFRNLKMTEFTLKEGVEVLGTVEGGQGIFQGCKLITNFELPSTVKTIEKNGLFMQKDAKYSVTCKAVEPPTVNGGTFLSATKANVKAIFVPANSVDKYKAAQGWSAFSSVIQAIQ